MKERKCQRRKKSDLKCNKKPLFNLEYPETGNSFNHKLNTTTSINDVKKEGRIRKIEEITVIVLLPSGLLFLKEK